MMPNKNCLICERIKLIKKKKNPCFVLALKTGYVVIGDYQFFKGYTLFLCKNHKKELHELKPEFRKKFLWEMSSVAEAVYKAFNPQKINCELLGNAYPHLHWHIFPRYKNDPAPTKPVWQIKKEIREAKSTKPDKKMLEKIKRELEKKLNKK